jgi:hypothetical protein
MIPERPPASVLWRRAFAAVGLGLLPFAVSAAHHWHVTHDAVRFLFRYTPERFVHGAVWTLPLSALITAQAAHVGVAVGVMLLLMAPYLIMAGASRTIVRFFAGHVSCTLIMLVAIVTTSDAGWATATRLYAANDTGISAGLAAVGGAFVVLLSRTRARGFAVVVGAIPLYFYTYRVGSEAAPAVMADLEHLIAFAVGMAIEWRRPLRAWPERISRRDGRVDMTRSRDAPTRRSRIDRSGDAMRDGRRAACRRPPQGHLPSRGVSDPSLTTRPKPRRGKV